MKTKGRGFFGLAVVLFLLLLTPSFVEAATPVQACTIADLQAVSPESAKFVRSSSDYFIKDGIVYETFSAGKDLPLPMPRIVRGRPVRIAVCLPGSMGPMPRHYNQMLKDVLHRGWELSLFESMSTPEQRKSFATAINKNVDAITITYWTMPALADLILEARERGIGVYTNDTELQPGVICMNTSHQGVGAAKLAYYILEQIGATAKVAFVVHPTEQAERERRDAMLAILKNYGVEVVGIEEPTAWEGAEEKILHFSQDMLTKYGNKGLKWIVAICDQFGVPAARAIEQMNYGGKVFTNGMDGSDMTFDMVRNGNVLRAIAVQPFEWYSHMGFEETNEVQVKAIAPLSPKSMIGVVRVVFGEQGLLTKENLPPVGTSVHAIFNYYGGDREDPNAWYNWKEAGGIARIGFYKDLPCYPEQVKK